MSQMMNVNRVKNEENITRFLANEVIKSIPIIVTCDKTHPNSWYQSFNDMRSMMFIMLLVDYNPFRSQFIHIATRSKSDFNSRNKMYFKA